MEMKSAAGGWRFDNWIIPGILYVNIGMFIVTLLIHPLKTSFSLNPLTFLAPDNGSIMLLGATGSLPFYRLGRWWTLISANYLHGSLLHLVFNMLAFRQIAPSIVNLFGGSRMIIIYTVSGMFGFWVSCIARIPLTIGASAALCGLMGAALYYGKSRGGAFGQAIFQQIKSWIVGLVIFGLVVPGINNWGHGGGLICGIVCGALLGYREKSEENRFHQLMAVLLVTVTIGILIRAVGMGFFARFR
jgi:rhomboid protease GluP